LLFTSSFKQDFLSDFTGRAYSGGQLNRFVVTSSGFLISNSVDQHFHTLFRCCVEVGFVNNYGSQFKPFVTSATQGVLA